MRWLRKAWVVVVVAVLGAPAASQDADRQAHGEFTGDVKPVVYVHDVEKSAPFYRDALGFEFLGYAGQDADPYYAELAAAGVKFGLHEPTSDAQKGRVGEQRLYFRVRDLARHRTRVAAWGGQPGEIRQTGWMDMFVVRDADGNEIVFAVTDASRHTSDPWRTGGEAPGENAQAR